METKETTLDKIRNRPRFKMYTHLSKESYAENLKKYLAAHKDEFTGNINTEIATISVLTEEDNFWKPCLALRTEIDKEITVVRGVFGPSPAVWTFFMFLYFLFSILWMTFFSMYYVEKEIGSNEYPWALAASFAMLFLIAGTYTAARIGQIKAKKQMTKLRKFAEESTLKFEKIMDFPEDQE